MRHSQFAVVVFFSALLFVVCAAGSPKTVDCLKVSVGSLPEICQIPRTSIQISPFRKKSYCIFFGKTYSQSKPR